MLYMILSMQAWLLVTLLIITPPSIMAMMDNANLGMVKSFFKFAGIYPTPVSGPEPSSSSLEWLWPRGPLAGCWYRQLQ